MPERRRKKRGIFDLFDFDEENFFGKEPGRGGSGYSISVTYDEHGIPLVKVETRGEVDVAELRKDIEQRYHGAKIEGLEKKQLIRVVGEEEAKEKEKKPKKEKSKAKKKRKKPLIKLVD